VCFRESACPSHLTDILCQESRAESPRVVAPTSFYQIKPLQDPRWIQLLKKHPRATVFHSTAWLEALKRTYGYESIAYTTSGPGEALQNAAVFCRVESWLTGRRLVSLPFSDYCAFLVDGPEDTQVFVAALEQEFRKGNWRYIEIRPLEPIESGPFCRPSTTYALHQLDLSPDIGTLFRNFHKDSIQRKIRRAEREGLVYREGSGEALLDTFYRLLIITRRRHQVPPQPKDWFRNLADCFGDALKIRIAFKDKHPVAGMLTLQYKDTMVYKYGGSDVRFNNLGSMHLLYWKSIQEAKNSGLQIFDLGRSDADQAGLITFKGRWGAAQSTLTYMRFAASGRAEHMFDPAGTSWKMRIAKQAFAHAPADVLSAVGKFLYKHVG
jgi:CelD/BcsL family acetyltransferase involved in cellulose biosynthesis